MDIVHELSKMMLAKMQKMKNDMQNNSVSKDYFTKYLKSNIPEKYIMDNMISHSYFSIQ